MVSTDKIGVNILLERCVQHGLDTIVFSPGSRNAPLAIAAENHPRIETLVIHDERVAAFFALGLALSKQKPVAVACTSGSAMLNYYPAVAEAFYQGVPLIVFSADRPSEWVNHGDGQTIVQKGVYKNHIQAECSVDEFCDNQNAFCGDVDTIFEKLNKWNGPVHFNIPLSEPLYNTKEFLLELPPLKKNDYSQGSIDIDALIKVWDNTPKKMILCGQMNDTSGLTQILKNLANDPSVIVLTENLSNIQDVSFVNCIDRALNLLPENELENYQPDLLITIGGAVVSKRIKKFLRQNENLLHWKVGKEFPEMDTFRARERKSFTVDSFDFLQLLSTNTNGLSLSNFSGAWRRMDVLMKDYSTEVLEELGYSDLTVFEKIYQYLPESSVLHMSNSSVIRYCQLFDPIKNVNYQCNRGTSGIDGSTSTALGYARESNLQNIFVTGDVSFFYDSNALWNQNLPKNFRIILINNSGGGIFRYIDGPSKTGISEKYFEARHSMKAKHLCELYDINYLECSSISELEEVLPSFLHEMDNTIQLLEVFTPSNLNDIVLKQYFEQTKKMNK